ncbi:MAG: exodeoxyribonuclease V subunit alpha [Desulfatiglandaceae bacterium]|jgi:exodeoxyribonuclease V alpha subunit
MTLNLHDTGLFSEIDLQFAGFLARISNRTDPALLLAAALVSRATGDGNVCLDLSTPAGQPLGEENGPPSLITCPDRSEWVAGLRKWDVVGNPGDETPLILDRSDRLYLFRYWEYEHLLARKIEEWSTLGILPIDEDRLRKDFSALFKMEETSGPDWQQVAAVAALTRPFCIISGGPGTGKSTVVGKILALLFQRHMEKPPKIALAAPTGKAAQRLGEAIRLASENLPLDGAVRQRIPMDASTLHRLLGTLSGSPYFRHNAGNPLGVDVVIVDEASMVDLPLMSKLVQALPVHGRLILLGDQDQLASVESGAVLGDLCDRGRYHGHSAPFCTRCETLTGQVIPQEAGLAIQDSLVRLETNYRFGSKSGIGVLSKAINLGDGEGSLSILKEGRHSDIRWVRLPELPDLARTMRKTILSGFGPYLKAENPEEAFPRFEAFQVLCALRKGPFGVVAVNRLVEQILTEEHLIRPEGPWYAGRPIMITRNDYNLGLFNGDVGLILPDPESGGDLRAFFVLPDGTPRKMHPLSLPEHETVFAMTVHKAQGSEFENVLLLLPDRLSPVLSRELIYTGLTRARKRIEVWGREEVFVEGVKRRIERSSGLREALWEK